MKLATRLNTFFLVTLAAVLVCFSLALYLFQRWASFREADGHLQAVLKTLVASIEVEPDGVEWNPREHRLEDPERSSIVWRVTDDSGAVVEETPGFATISRSLRPPGEGITTIDLSRGDRWRIATDRISIAEAVATLEPSPPSEPEPDDAPEYPALVLTAAFSISGVEADLDRLAGRLALLSIVVWTIAALCGRMIVRRALRPVTTMASAAGSMIAAPGTRLPVPDSNDEIAELGRAFNGLLDRLGEAFSRERRFTAEASHQLRTPVTALLGHVDVTLRRDRSPEEYRETLHEVRAQVDRLRRIIESLLALARSDDVTQRRPFVPVDLAGRLPDSLTTFDGHTRASDLTLSIPSNASWTVRTDPDLLGQLLEILIDNALKYSPRGTPVRVRASIEEGRIAIDVLDAGPGISDAEAADVFRPFHRGEEAVRCGVPGLGLGLALARRIADQIQADLTFDRPQEGGCRFRTLLPTDVSDQRGRASS